MNIPIKALKELSQKYGYDHIICFATKGKMQYVATYGRTLKECDEAAQFGNKMKGGLGWPESLHAMPSRVRAFQKRIKELEKQLEEAEQFHPRAMKLLRKKKNFIVVAEDEPYFIQAYNMIRDHEIQKGTWSDEDERIYKKEEEG